MKIYLQKIEIKFEVSYMTFNSQKQSDDGLFEVGIYTFLLIFNFLKISIAF